MATQTATKRVEVLRVFLAACLIGVCQGSPLEMEGRVDAQTGLAADDECTASGGDDSSKCALNALQHRTAAGRVRLDAGRQSGRRWWHAGVNHYARNCWAECQGAGMCEHYCGEGNACCRYGYSSSDPPECQGVTWWPVMHCHTCVKSPWTQPGPAQPAAPIPTTIYKDASLFQPSSAPLLEFYMYRVQSDEDYDPENQNLGNIGGMLWYLHNEIVWHPGLQRSGTYFSTAKTRLERFRVKMRATQPLWGLGMNFGVVNEFDFTRCTGPFGCHNFARFGFTVGCETWVKGSLSDFPHTQWDSVNFYPGAAWYSFPGACPSQPLNAKTEECRKREPGGRCTTGGDPTGTGDCTYTYEKVGEISIDELEGLEDPEQFLKLGGQEYDKDTDRGTIMHFWDDMNNVTANQIRIDHAHEVFRSKFPGQPDLPDPPCDFNKRKFFPGRYFSD